jgi:hypothetical protein
VDAQHTIDDKDQVGDFRFSFEYYSAHVNSEIDFGAL